METLSLVARKIAESMPLTSPFMVSPTLIILFNPIHLNMSQLTLMILIV